MNTSNANLGLFCRRMLVGCLLAVGLLQATLVDVRTFETEHFDITFDPTQLSDQSTTPINFDLPPGWDATKLGSVAPDYLQEPNFIRCLACYLEYAHETYGDDGFLVPTGKTQVWVFDLSGKLGMVVPPLLDWLFLHPSWYGGPVPTVLTVCIDEAQSLDDLRSTAVHEMTHVVQLQYWGLYNLCYPAFVEGPAVAIENTMIPEWDRYTWFCMNSNHDYPDWGPGFFTMNTASWSGAYSTGIIWLYLMEHVGDPGLRYPGLDFLRDFYIATATTPQAWPTESKLFDSLDSLLDARGTSLDDEMENFAFANMIRLYENLGGDHPWGFWWDDDSSFFNYGSKAWNDYGVDEYPLYGELTRLYLNAESLETELANAAGGVFEHQDNMNTVYGYGCQYWQYRDDLRDLVRHAGGLSYDGPGLPYRVQVEVEEQGSQPYVLSATAFRDTNAIFHESGVIRFDDDRIYAAAFAVGSYDYVDHYLYRHTLEPYEASDPSHGPIGGLAFEHTYRLPLAPHQILMRGITNAYDYQMGTIFSAVAFSTNSGLTAEAADFLCPQPDFLYSDEDSFQFNLRRFSGTEQQPGFYLNHTQSMVSPAGRDDMANHYIQNASGNGFYRLDLRQDPADQCSTGLLLTVFPYSVLDSLKPDLLVRDWLFSLDSAGRLTGRIAILNQGTAQAAGIRIPVFVTAMAWGPLVKGLGRQASWDTTLVIDTTIDLDACSTFVMDVDHQTGWDWQDEVSRERLSRTIAVWVEIGVNSAKGLEMAPLNPPAELTMSNNGPERVAVYCFFSPEDSQLFLPGDIAAFADWLQDESDSVTIVWELDPDLRNLPPEYGWNLVNRAKELAVFDRVQPWLLETPFKLPGPQRGGPGEELSLFSAFRLVTGWADLVGLGGYVPDDARELASVDNPSHVCRVWQRGRTQPFLARAPAADSVALDTDNPGLGDVNKDSATDGQDALLMLNILLGAAATDPAQAFSADIDNDARLSLGDLLFMYGQVPER